MKICLLISVLLLGFNSLSIEKTEISCSATVAIDSSSNYSIVNFNELQKIPLKQNQLLNLGFNIDYAVWGTFTLKNTSNRNQSTWICFSNNRIDSLELFINGTRQLIGDRTTRNSHFIMLPAFKIEIPANSELTLVIRLKKGISFFDFSYSLKVENSLESESRVSIFLISFFTGLTFLFLILTTVLFLISRKTLYLYYIVYSALTMIYALIATGFAKFIFFPSVTYFSEGLIYTASLWFISLSLFIAKFLNLKDQQFKKYRIIILLVWFNVAIIVVTLLQLTFHEYTYLKLLSTLGYINFLLTILVLIISSFSHLKINRTYAIYALISFLPHFLWALSIILQAFNIPIFGIHANWLVIIAFFDVLFFGLILTKDYLETYRKNDQLQQVIIENQTSTIQSITDAQIRERKQLANIIHDHFGSKLTHVLHLLELENHELVEQNIRELTQEMREISHQILPKSLENGAFSSSIQHQINQFNQGLKNAKIELHTFDFPEIIDEKLAVTLFLISLELISNALNHGEATEVTMELFGYTEMLVIQVSDNGKGFDSNVDTKGFGITTIENRVLNLKGTIEISSVLSEGTYVQITVPR